MLRRFAPFALALAALASLLAAAPTRAQEASPAAGAGCTIAPRSTESLLALWFGPGGTPAATPTAAPAPDLAGAVPADAATATAIRQTVEGLIACVNAGDYGRYYAYLTDNVAAQFGPEPGAREADARTFLTTPQPLPADKRQTVVAVEDVVVLADGRAAARVTVDDPTQNPARQTALVTFRQVGGQWLVDGFSPEPGTGTPVATPGA
jgi:hypothetical protein